MKIYMFLSKSVLFYLFFFLQLVREVYSPEKFHLYETQKNGVSILSFEDPTEPPSGRSNKKLFLL